MDFSPELIREYRQVFPHHSLFEPQIRFYGSHKRNAIVPAGRRSGKTAIATAKLVRRAVLGPPYGKYLCAAPTHQQAKRIFWTRMKDLTRPAWATAPSESDRTIYLRNGSQIIVGGLDKPERFEGIAIDGVLIDEFADVKESAWSENLRPALADPSRPVPGWAILTGVPQGRGFYFDRWTEAQEDTTWETLTWHSAAVLDPAEIAVLRSELDARTFAQEMEASFLTTSGRIYYAFDRELHLEPTTYDPTLPLDLSFDFNVAPGTAIISQEQPYRGARPNRRDTVTAVLGEVYIELDSNTERVVARLLQVWAPRVRVESGVRLFGDATGGARGSAKLAGSDWSIIQAMVRSVWPASRIIDRVPKSNPPERERVNAMNSRLLAVDGTVSMILDPSAAHLAKDLDGVTALEGSAGDIDKRSDPKLTHASDALGYLVHALYRVDKPKTTTTYGLFTR